MLHMQYGLVYLCELLLFLVCGDIRSSCERLGSFVVVVLLLFFFFLRKILLLRKLFTLRLKGVKLTEN